MSASKPTGAGKKCKVQVYVGVTNTGQIWITKGAFGTTYSVVTAERIGGQRPQRAGRRKAT